jgi:DHA1 family tetracycline resistance protein-like MFS transporter
MLRIIKRTIRLDYAELIPLWIAVFVDILGFSILIPFLPFFSQEYGAPAWQIGLLLSTNAMFGFFSGPIWGSLSDRYGRKPMLLISQFGTLAGFLMLAFSRNLPMLFASRIVDGIFGGNFPIAKAVIGDVVPPSERSRHMSNIGVAHVLASLVGPGLGGLLSQWGILAPGLLSAALTCITITVTFRYLRESNPSGRRSRAKVVSEQPTTRTSIWRNGAARYLLVQWGFHTMSFMIYVSCIALFANLLLGLDSQEMGLLLMGAGVVRVLVRFLVFIPPGAAGRPQDVDAGLGHLCGRVPAAGIREERVPVRSRAKHGQLCRCVHARGAYGLSEPGGQAVGAGQGDGHVRLAG